MYSVYFQSPAACLHFWKGDELGSSWGKPPSMIQRKPSKVKTSMIESTSTLLHLPSPATHLYTIIRMQKAGWGFLEKGLPTQLWRICWFVASVQQIIHFLWEIFLACLRRISSKRKSSMKRWIALFSLQFSLRSVNLHCHEKDVKIFQWLASLHRLWEGMSKRFAQQ